MYTETDSGVVAHRTSPIPPPVTPPSLPAISHDTISPQVYGALPSEIDATYLDALRVVLHNNDASFTSVEQYQAAYILTQDIPSVNLFVTGTGTGKTVSVQIAAFLRGAPYTVLYVAPYNVIASDMLQRFPDAYSSCRIYEANGVNNPRVLIVGLETFGEEGFQKFVRQQVENGWMYGVVVDEIRKSC